MEAEEKDTVLQYAREYFNSGQSTYRDSCVTTPNIYLSFIMHSQATKWLLHAEEKLQRLLSAHKTVCLLSKFLYHINHPRSTTIQNWQESGLDSSRFLRDTGRNKSKDLQVYKGL
jgi:hypothetical protein